MHHNKLIINYLLNYVNHPTTVTFTLRLRLMGTKTTKIKFKAMKTINILSKKTLFVLAVFLGFQFATTFAAVKSSERVLSNTPAVINLSALFPVTPMVADFSDGAPSTDISLVKLAPVTPKEADFEEVTGTKNTSSIQDLAPVTPAAADFEDIA